MAKSERQKLKLLYLRDYLQENTDEKHPVTVQELIDFLATKDIRAERKSIYDDILCLQEYGADIEQRKGRSGGYYLASRDFELPEIKLLVQMKKRVLFAVIGLMLKQYVVNFANRQYHPYSNPMMSSSLRKQQESKNASSPKRK